MENYDAFLATKKVEFINHGVDARAEDIHPSLFKFQRDIVLWALRKGRAAIFAETGLGKTVIQIEWARIIARETNGKVLILCPLAVAHQTVIEGRRVGVPIHYSRSQEDADSAEESIIITNYEMIQEFTAANFTGIVLDESSILKSFTGSTKRTLVEMFSRTPYRLACTATPAPNDHLEFGNHSEFLGVMHGTQMISRWFINDTMQAGSYRLKRHAAADYWRWMTSWAMCISKPSDLGDAYQDEDELYTLPPLNLHSQIVGVDHSRAWDSGQLLLTESLSATGMWKEKRATAFDRCQKAKEIVGDSEDAWIIWCDTNDEADLLIKLFPDAVEVRGSDSIREKERKLSAFSDGQVKKIITKSEIAGFGLNWQHCHNMVFVGVSYSFEKLYQALRRSWRFRQTHAVQAHLIYAETEGDIIKTIQEKQEKHKDMQQSMSKAMRENGLDGLNQSLIAAEIINRNDVATGKNWRLYLGDCVERIHEIPDDSVHFSVYSPPFSNLYIYTDTPQDMGNTTNDEEFFKHYSYLLPEILRITKPGRLTAVHCKDLPMYMNRDGAAGLRDFPGMIVRAHEQAGWVFHSRVTIWKDPVIEMQRTKNHGLLWKNFSDRGEVVRQGMADYLLIFRKWAPEMEDKQVSNRPQPGQYHGENPPKSWDSERDYSIQVWQKYASPVWFDINQTNVLNIQMARTNEDEKHICPLQLDVIDRAVEIWTNPGDVVFSPFAGIGSEGYQSLKLDRKFIGIELKESYWNVAVRHLKLAESEKNQITLFDFAEAQAAD